MKLTDEQIKKFSLSVREIGEIFEAIGKELIEKLKPIGEACKEINEAIEREEKRRKKGGLNERIRHNTKSY